MEGEKLDAIIFGATGFTGQIVVGDAIDILKDFKWGIAGRNELKLKTLLEDMGQKMQIDLSYIPVVVANVNDQISIETMAQKCKIVINCCGPYQVFGEVVVKACINAGTHHVDLSGVINSIELHAVIKPNYQDTSSKAILNYGTWESLICSMQYARELLTLERKLNKEEMPKLTPKLWMRPYPHRTETLSEYFAPFPITDRTVVQRSQRLFYMREQKRPIQFEMYMGFRSFFLALIFPLLLILGVIMAQMSFTRKLLLKYPHTFSRGLMTHQGPTETNRKAAEFSYVVNAKGWSEGTPQTDAPNKVVMVRVSGKDPCYGVTSSCLLTSAKVILQEHQIMPGKGGVLPPGFAFAPTQLLKEMEMCKSGLKFEILKL
ncbi:saccharopine dehydrogenase-like oxidoreductase isoform X2 [Stomoxys calcitrans]|uniref:saccharopine dehydrogenase-like oxidoreductase isoform X2 n=1 Tax=Stomoxys calcitrans TaxID=35570 RepID=UPI0027E35D34|nr:saccharopine dehydrogenase-like oxidoreductase isoform X2 [Stomoxys calcitrans]